MSGYKAECVDGRPKSGLTCVHCKLLLRSPVQTEEGQRLCRPCVNHIKSLSGGRCDDCEIVLTSSDSFYPDKAVQREVQAVNVFCKFKSNGCQWQGVLKKWEDHIANCEFKGVACPNEGCGQSFTVSALEEHKIECGYRLISCDHCSATIRFNIISKHETECEEMIITCEEESCSAMFKRKELNYHKENNCTIVNCLTCGVKVTRTTGIEMAPSPSPQCHQDPLSSSSNKSAKSSSNELQDSPPLSSARKSRKSSACRGMSQADFITTGDQSLIAIKPGTLDVVHLSDDVQNFQHHHELALKVRDIENNVNVKLAQQESSVKELVSVREHSEKLMKEKSGLQKELSSVKTELSDIRHMMQDLRRQSSSQRSEDYEKLQIQVEELAKADREKAEVMNSLKMKLEELKRDIKQNASSISPMGSFGGVETDNIRSGISRKGVGAMELRGHTALGSGFESGNFQQMRQMEEFQRQLGMMRVQLSELELQLQASLASTYNGNFLWRIPDVTRRRRDAVDGRVTSIYSPPFYTGRNGYKMCIRGYLNGDGMGFQSHLSLFFVIMRGECDPLLKWPFEYKVSMILVDQTHRKHIVQTFKPTPESNSFQQPKTEMNVASGCPQFAKLNIFDDPCYVKDDVMYIKCIVDTTKIFHP